MRHIIVEKFSLKIYGLMFLVTNFSALSGVSEAIAGVSQLDSASMS